MAKKIHKLITVEDIANVVTEKNYEGLMKDLALCFAQCVQLKKEKLFLGLKEIEWKDDGINDISFIALVDENGKEIQRIKNDNFGK